MTPRTLVGLSLAAGLLILAGTACAPPRMAVAVHAEPGLEGWERAHPEAARDLGAWVREHPDAARQFFAWMASIRNGPTSSSPGPSPIGTRASAPSPSAIGTGAPSM